MVLIDPALRGTFKIFNMPCSFLLLLDCQVALRFNLFIILLDEESLLLEHSPRVEEASNIRKTILLLYDLASLSATVVDDEQFYAL